MDKDSKEYKKAKKLANQKYGTNSSLYRSAYIVKKYKELNGKFKGKKPSAQKGLKRWIEGEKWIHVIPYLTKGEIIPCGSSGKVEPCRPLKIANEKTPLTIKELLKIHSKEDILKAARAKKRNPEKRLTWKTLKLS